MTFHGGEPVASGLAYSVMLVAGLQPKDLNDFVGARYVVVSMGDQTLRLTGTGAMDAGRVNFTQKDAGAGRDVRVWSILEADDGYTAVPEGLMR